MFGNYTTDAVKEISINRTQQAIETIRDLGGEVKCVYALLGEYDLLFWVDLPDIEAAMKASLIMTRITDVSFRTCPAVKVEIFDKLATA